MSIFRDSYRHEVEARYKEAVQDRLKAILDMNEASPSLFTRGALGKLFGGGVRESIAQLKDEILPETSPMRVQTIGALIAVDRDVRSNARRSHSEGEVSAEINEIWDDLHDQVSALTTENVAAFLAPDDGLQSARVSRDASAFDEVGEVKGSVNEHGNFTRFSPPGHGR